MLSRLWSRLSIVVMHGLARLPLVCLRALGALLGWGERLSWGRGYRVHVQPLATALPADNGQAATLINQAMEALIRNCPQQYLWGYARYKRPRQEL